MVSMVTYPLMGSIDPFLPASSYKCMCIGEGKMLPCFGVFLKNFLDALFWAVDLKMVNRHSVGARNP